MPNHKPRALLLFALWLAPSLAQAGRAYDAPIFASRGEEFSVVSLRKEDDRILGSLSFTDHARSARRPDPCRFKQVIERIDIYADGRINQVTQTQGSVCKRGRVRQRTLISTPRLSIVSPERLAELFDALKSKQSEVESRALAANGPGDSPLVLSLSPEPGGSESRAALHRVVVENGQSNRAAWKAVRKLIAAAISNGS